MAFINKFVLTIFLLSLLSACAHSDRHEPARRFESEEELLDTNGPITRLYHSAIYFPDEIALQYDGYIVGLEKISRDRTDLKDDAERHFLDYPEAKLQGEWKGSGRLGDGKFMFVTHIIANQVATEKPGDPRQNCFVYNAYKMDLPASLKKGGPGAPYTSAFAQDCSPSYRSPAERHEPRQLFANSWKAMNALGASMKQRIADEKYTDVIVIVMGWNTVQEEAVRNFNSIARHILQTHRKPFKPLFIGVTWPSQWNSIWFDPVFKLLSFDTKRTDADEVGLTWLGVLLQQTIPRALPATNAPVVSVIGHSFGARATAVGACVGPLVKDVLVAQQPRPARPTVDNLINLQGAYPAKRLFEPEAADIAFPDRCANAKRLMVTASRFDDAVTQVRLITQYVGDSRAYQEVCAQTSPAVRCVKAPETGQLDATAPGAEARILYVDADALIYENAYNSGGGAHSDIYRKEHGVMINRFIEAR